MQRSQEHRVMSSWDVNTTTNIRECRWCPRRPLHLLLVATPKRVNSTWRQSPLMSFCDSHFPSWSRNAVDHSGKTPRRRTKQNQQVLRTTHTWLKSWCPELSSPRPPQSLALSKVIHPCPHNRWAGKPFLTLTHSKAVRLRGGGRYGRGEQKTMGSLAKGRWMELVTSSESSPAFPWDSAPF